MNLCTWMGLLLVGIFLAGSYLRVRARRRAGIVRDFGHPVLDNLLVLVSGLLLAAFLAVAVFLVRLRHFDPVKERAIGYPLLILAGSLITWLCNWVLRRRTGDAHGKKDDQFDGSGREGGARIGLKATVER
jgi:prepilin signal peptidase PulO-like enzyme (type II secretory pathway)